MQMVGFSYKCQECGRGNVVEEVVPEYHTKVRGYPFTVRDARIGVCDVCGAKHFAAQETERWERIFEEERAKLFLRPRDLQSLRKSLGLSMEHFAFLIGSTRQSLYNWERHDRTRLQSRMADLLMKLVRESQIRGSVDVIRFLIREAEQLGVHVELGRHNVESARPLLELWAKQVYRDVFKAPVPVLAQMVAETVEGDTQVLLFDPKDEPVGRLSYDFENASLQLDFIDSPGFDRFIAEVHFTDGTVEKSGVVQLENLHAKLLSPTRRTDDKVSRLVLQSVSDAGEDQ